MRKKSEDTKIPIHTTTRKDLYKMAILNEIPFSEALELGLTILLKMDKDRDFKKRLDLLDNDILKLQGERSALMQQIKKSEREKKKKQEAEKKKLVMEWEIKPKRK